MNAHQLRCFVAVVDFGSVSKAAEALHMTQPPLSILIRKLEAHHQVTLFDRVNNRLIPSQAGLLLYRRAKDLLASMQAIHHELQECHHGLRGTIRWDAPRLPACSSFQRLCRKSRSRA